MFLADLIDKLVEIHNMNPGTDFNPEVSVMTELEHKKIQIQVQDLVTDVAYSDRSGVIIIGKEID